MDKAAFVQKVKMLCLMKGIKPTNACKESGVGGSFLSDISSRGQSPSVERVQKLAAYLGVTTSELLGEEERSSPAGPDANIIKIAGRDGSFVQRRLTDEQMKAFTLMLDQLPDADGL